ncbi:transporter [Ralstonia syzygii subsp. celebesensis]|uniref:Uncharacterized protein n=1 Tax=blood disease bacterium R229 TaxID=741978 RepID=G2ZSX5_9RALS|nr:transporter [Ralstonia syzygii]CCA82138.1 hypothetical protein BDB_180181 [blood disease bacterium R229]
MGPSAALSHPRLRQSRTPAHPGGELSSNIQLNVNGRNHDTDYRSGIEYQHEFAIGQHIGPWTVGIGGYYSQQLTDDTQAGKPIEGKPRPTRHSSVRGIQPAASAH